ncbi:unnamed protein product [Clonostachys rhizophaga]|uniref:Uncharacterized protein n=1 Tax=Clonostachys rhizophaga TaxID=160324 RepID=A0A9N9VM86_9HYPO|nr:unnamed protein product [Clonostachys rhizophaga]
MVRPQVCVISVGSHAFQISEDGIDATQWGVSIVTALMCLQRTVVVRLFPDELYAKIARFVGALPRELDNQEMIRRMECFIAPYVISGKAVVDYGPRIGADRCDMCRGTLCCDGVFSSLCPKAVDASMGGETDQPNLGAYVQELRVNGSKLVATEKDDIKRDELIQRLKSNIRAFGDQGLTVVGEEMEPWDNSL